MWLFVSSIGPKVRPYRLKKFFAYKQNKANLISFTCVSLFHYKISLLFFRFFSVIFASNFSLRFTFVIFASKWNKAKRNSSLFFRFFHFFSLFFVFFRFSFFASLRFSHFYLEAKWSEAKFKSIFLLFSLFFRFASIFFT